MLHHDYCEYRAGNSSNPPMRKATVDKSKSTAGLHSF